MLFVLIDFAGNAVEIVVEEVAAASASVVILALLFEMLLLLEELLVKIDNELMAESRAEVALIILSTKEERVEDGADTEMKFLLTDVLV